MTKQTTMKTNLALQDIMGKNTLLIGGSGVGKSHLIEQKLVEIKENNENVSVTVVTDFKKAKKELEVSLEVKDTQNVVIFDKLDTLLVDKVKVEEFEELLQFCKDNSVTTFTTSQDVKNLTKYSMDNRVLFHFPLSKVDESPQLQDTLAKSGITEQELQFVTDTKEQILGKFIVI